MSGSITALVRVLVEGGATPQLILAAVEQAELAKDNALDRSREKARNRIKKWREKQAGNVTERSVTTTKRLTRVEDNNLPTEITGEEKKDDAAPSARPKATRIPDDFVPDERWAVGEGLSPFSAGVEARQFIDFWRSKSGKDGTKQDWPATWRVWVRNSIKRQPGPRSGAPPPKPKSIGDIFRDDAKRMGLIPNDEPPDQPTGRVATGNGSGEGGGSGVVVSFALPSNVLGKLG